VNVAIGGEFTVRVAQSRRVNARAALQSPVIAAAISAVLSIGFVLGVWNTRDRDVTRFIVAGANAVDRTRLPPGIALVPDSVGYDGTAFYRLALDPFTSEVTDFGITLDMPAYRQQRILYPLLVWALSGGRPAAIPTMLVVVNVLALVALGFLGALLAQQLGRPALWGLLFPLYPGFLYSISRDLCEPLACAFALAAMVAVARRRPVLGATFLCCAVLTRETFLLLAVAYAVEYVWSRRTAPVVFLAPLAIYAAWQLILAWNWGVTPLRAGAHHLVPALPFADYWNVLVTASSFRRLHRLHFSEGLYLGIAAVAAATAWRYGALAWRLAWLGCLVLASTLLHNVWAEDVSYMRVLSDFYLLSAAIVLAGGAVQRWVLGGATAVVWYYLGMHLIKYG
jgi:hypothetical protein